MGARYIDLNEPPEGEDIVQYVMLQKDNKHICRTKCLNLPFQVPSLWTITEFRPSRMYLQSNWPRCQLYPEHENSYQKREWGLFLRYIWKNKMVALVRCESCSFYILAPDECPPFTHAIVPYRMRKPSLPFVNLKAATPEDTIKKSSKKEQVQLINHETRVSNPGILVSPEELLINEDSKHHSGGKVVDSVAVPTQNKEYNISKSYQAAVDLGPPCESVEDAPRRSQPTMGDHIKRNFVKTDPSYLQTLGQTHSGWIFGAIAELVDNARDAEATRLTIQIESLYSKKAGSRIPVLSIVDDGHGMSHNDIVRMLSFGHKALDGEDPNRIGRFGIGFKTGSMRIGKDALVLTQTSRSRSVALLSQTYNEKNENLEIPIITYCKQGQYMEVDLSIQSEECADFYLKAIKEVSPFNEYSIGEKLGLFGEKGTGTQIYIWNLDRWGLDYCLEWGSGKNAENSPHESRSDILIRSRRVRSRPGQISQKVLLDYSLHSYLEVIFLSPRMKIWVQGSLVKTRPLVTYLNKTVVVNGQVMGNAVQLTLGRSQRDWERVNCGIFLYWHGRLIEAYKRVGGMIHNADMGRGVLGVIDVTNIMDDGDGRAWVLNNKQGFQDCETYAKLEQWLGNKTDEYWDDNFDDIDVKKGDETYKPDHEWVQCNKCRKWRILVSSFGSENLPPEWFCYMPPFNGKCAMPEQPVGRGVITLAAKRSGYEKEENILCKEKISKLHSLVTNINSASKHGKRKQDADKPLKNDNSYECGNSALNHGKRMQDTDKPLKNDSAYEESSEEEPLKIEDHVVRHSLKRLRRGPSRGCKQT